MKSNTLAYVGYNTTIAVTSPLWMVYLVMHGTRRGRGLSALREQLGFLGREVSEGVAPRIWVHAASAGETVASTPIVNGIAETLPDAEIVFSSTTTSGRQIARSKLAVCKHLVYFPLDLPLAVKRSLSAVRPRVYASVEAEIWPNFLHCAHAMGVRTAVLNGVVTDKTLRRARMAGWVYRWALGSVDRFCMQSEKDAAKIISLGARESRVTVVGNTKFDEPFPELTEGEKQSLLAEFRFPETSEVIVAGSTNPGEEEPVLEAFIEAAKARNSLKLIIAPRHIERAEEIVGLVSSHGLRVGLRTRSNKLTGIEDVVVLDTLGELAKIYGIGAVAFVGGTLIPKGGHNLLQPIAQGKPVLFGPYTFKTADVADMVIDAGVGFGVRGADDLGARIVEMLSAKSRLVEIAEAANRLIAANRGAAARCVEVIADLYGDRPEATGPVDLGTYAIRTT